MIGVRAMDCCGVKEITSARNVVRGTTIRSILQDLVDAGLIYDNRLRAGTLIFTQAGRRSAYGRRLSKLITDNELGTVTQMDPFSNPNTGHIITMFVWKPNTEKLCALVQEFGLVRDPYYYYISGKRP